MSATLLSRRSVSLSDQMEARQSLLRAVKKEVKQIMEEAVTRKFVHEESSSITSLCGAVEACLLHGLRKRALGLFKFSNTTALLQKVSKSYEPAMEVVRIVSDIELNNDPNKKPVDSSKNPTKRQTSFSFSPKYLWIRIAIFEKKLAKILDYLVQNNNKYYESFALISDPVDGPILASLLVGPCALDYTKMKTSDHFWTDPPADELVQRHRIHSGGHHMTSGAASPGSPKQRPGLQMRPQIPVRRNQSSSSEESSKSFHMSAREYVESLHQNSRSTLLYGKNNVLVQAKEGAEALQGYLSLHQTVEGLTIMWTPNQLMNGCCEQPEDTDRSHFWDYALTIFLDEIVYIHCHQQPDCRGTIVLVGQDGVQRPPIHFPKGGHLLAFLSCLETGLLPHGQLDPPLWSQRGKGKVFPKLKRKGSRLSNLSTSSKEGSTSSTSSTDLEEEATDYVFRIVKVFKPDNIPPEVMDPKAKFRPADLLPWALTRIPRGPSPLAQNTVQTYALVQEEQNNSMLTKVGSTTTRQGNTIKQLCDTMRKQIISRAFYGWLAHCRHLKTVRTHLSGLVLHRIFPIDQPYHASKGLTALVWEQMCKTGTVTGYPEVFRLVYYGGIEHSIRKQVWPFMLGHYKFDSSIEDREFLDKKTQTLYEKTMSEWLAIEAIIRQREKEVMAANLAKLSSESTDGNIPLVRKDSSLDNDVFLSQSFDSDEFSHPETVPEESSATGTTCCTPDRKQSMDLHFEVSDKLTQTDACSFITKREYLTSYTTDSPDDGLGDSIARHSSQERLKSDSLGDSESTDLSKPDREGSTERARLIKMSADSSGLEEDENEADDEAGDDDDDDEDQAEAGENEHEAMEEDTTLEGTDTTCGTEGQTDAAVAVMLEGGETTVVDERVRQLSTSKESLMSPASPASHGGVYAPELLDNVALNLHRIDKDVQRCDRNYHYFTLENLEKLRNIMCTYVWEHLDVGYVQGMCDLLAPLLVILDDEAKTYSCFCELMKRMCSNFPHGGAMDTHFANMRSLIQILDSELFEHMHHHGDYTHFYFCYRWFLLDFKREFVYDDIFLVWETIWAARYISSANFVLFIALALVEYYREIILDNNMDFTDIIKFFNEMAERHEARQVLKIARELILRQQTLIDNK
ncbi:small G protein signaling modulator 1-like [Dreissena polymorpha]|uniref:small G protein signaling modulator 1-like n=1 Tax=Dreissena polymorpha TaxID=45954 RepID=UPI0022645C36|nr:small G protein signaling modulator 1-like [Dreissena polymorpha]